MGGKEGGKKEIRRKEKKKRTGRKHETPEHYKFYKLNGSSLERTKPSCPRCGPGTWLAVHTNRSACGRCGYAVIGKR